MKIGLLLRQRRNWFRTWKNPWPEKISGAMPISQKISALMPTLTKISGPIPILQDITL